MGYTWNEPRSKNYIDKKVEKMLDRQPRISNREYWDTLSPKTSASSDVPKLHKYPGDNMAQRFLFGIGRIKDETGSFSEEPPSQTRIRGLGIFAIVSGTIAGTVLFVITRENGIASDIPVNPVVCTTEKLLSNDHNIQGYEINLAEAFYAADQCHGDSQNADLTIVNQTAHDALANLGL